MGLSISGLRTDCSAQLNSSSSTRWPTAPIPFHQKAGSGWARLTLVWSALTSTPGSSSPGLRVITPPRSSGIASLHLGGAGPSARRGARKGELVSRASIRSRSLRGSLFVSPPDRSHATTCRGPRLECEPIQPALLSRVHFLPGAPQFGRLLRCPEAARCVQPQTWGRRAARIHIGRAVVAGPIWIPAIRWQSAGDYRR